MYVIMGASGNTGNVVARALLAEGKKVRVIGRSADRLEPLIENTTPTSYESFVAEEFVPHYRGRSTTA